MAFSDYASDRNDTNLLFPPAEEGAGHLIEEVFGIGPVGIVAIAIFPLEVSTKIIGAAFYLVGSCVVHGKGGVFQRRVGE